MFRYIQWLSICVLAGVLLFSCSDNNSVNTESEDQREILLPDQELAANTSKAKSTTSTTCTHPEDAAVYTFDDLTYKLAWNNELPNPYRDLQFQSTPYYVVHTALFRDGYSIIPANSSYDYHEMIEMKITLPHPTTYIHIDAFWYGGDAATIVAYNDAGEEIARASATQFNREWNHLVIDSLETAVTTIGLHAPNVGTQWDDLMIEKGPEIPDNQKPVADAGSDETVEATGSNGAAVVLDGTGSSDPDGDALTYHWSTGDQSLGDAAEIETTLSVGTHTVTLTVTDDNGASAQDEVVVEVVDTTPPEIQADMVADKLWPPNNKMRLVVQEISATDLVSEVATSVDVMVDDAGSNFDNDWRVEKTADGTYNVWVRATRDGRGTGRSYAISISSTDASGNTATEFHTVTVAHDQGNKKGNKDRKARRN